MSTNDVKTSDPKSERPDPKRPETRDEPQKKTPGLDFARLDLSIEKVEERISPSETNVFDK